MSTSPELSPPGTPSTHGKSLRRTVRLKDIRKPSIALLVGYRFTDEHDGRMRLVTKGVQALKDDNVGSVVLQLLRDFEIVTVEPESWTLYAPAPVNSYLKRTEALSTYSFLGEKCELELRYVETTSTGADKLKSAIAGALSPEKSGRRTMTLDLGSGKPMMLKIFHYKDANSMEGEHIMRKMLFQGSDLVKVVVERVRARFQMSDRTEYQLYAPPPFDQWLEEDKTLGKYMFLNTHMNVLLRAKEKGIILRVVLGKDAQGTRMLKVDEGTTIAAIVTRLLEKFPVDSPNQWGLVGKARDSPTKYWLPMDEPIDRFTHMNLMALHFRKREDPRGINRRESVAVLHVKPTSCLGVDPSRLDQVDDDGTTAPACLIKMRDALLDRFGLQTERIFLYDAPEEAWRRVIDDIDKGNDLREGNYDAVAIATAIKQWYARLPCPVFQPLEKKLERAATNYEASLLLAAQLPQDNGLLLAWLMALLVEVALNLEVNNVTVTELGAAFAGVLVRSDIDAVNTKLKKIVAIILEDKVDERLERQEMLGSYSSQYRHSTQENQDMPPPVPSRVCVGWSANDVAEWLSKIEIGGEGMNFSEISMTFLANDIDGEALVLLEKADLARLGITKLGHQKKILKYIQELP